MASAGRLKKETEDLKRDTTSGVSIVVDALNPNHLIGVS
jgi:hypothetical protein